MMKEVRVNIFTIRVTKLFSIFQKYFKKYYLLHLLNLYFSTIDIPVHYLLSILFDKKKCCAFACDCGLML